jgi:hypothetical protein
VRAMFRDDQRLRFGKVEDLTGNVPGRHRRGQRLAAQSMVVSSGAARLAVRSGASLGLLAVDADAAVP